MTFSVEILRSGRLLDKFRRTSRQVVNRLSEYCHKDVVSSSLVSNLARSAPFFGLSLQEVEENKIDSWEKELAASLGPDRPPCLNYRLWFSEDDSIVYTESLAKNLNPQPRTNSRIRSAFREWADNLSGSLLFPQVQANKSVSRMTAFNYARMVSGQELESFDNQVSSSDLERMYAASGTEISGPCELRQAWKYNDLTPRTYFASGGTTYHASKYIRGPMNALVNSFPESHFITRFSIQDVELSQSHTAFIYDYSSFTSNLTEYKRFLDALADFSDSVEVQLVDSRAGIINWSLGALIREYNQVCNIQGEFMVNRYQDGNNSVLRHSRAGFLGVYGNIAGSTALHALHAANLVGDSGSSRCVGDDACGATPLDDFFTRQDLVSAIQNLGEVQESKVNYWVFRDIEDESEDIDHSWPYTKRPLDRVHNRLVLEQALYLPIFGLINPIVDEIHEDPVPVQERNFILAQQTFSTIRQCRQLFPPLSLAQQGIVRKFLEALYIALGVPREGRLPFESYKVQDKLVSGVLLPSLEDGFLDNDPWSLLENRFVNRSTLLVSIPRCSLDSEARSGEAIRNRGFSVVTTMDRKLAYLEKMGWLTSRELTEVRLMDFSEYRRYYELLFSGDHHRLYDVCVLETAPKWIIDLV